jgi:uncharacterized protein with HEPN domain
MRNPQERVRDMLEAIASIERHTSCDKSTFEKEEVIQVWLVHHLRIIEEAAAQLSRDFRAAHPDVPCTRG